MIRFIQRFASLLFLLLLAACAGGGYGDPWKRPPSAPADHAPYVLGESEDTSVLTPVPSPVSGVIAEPLDHFEMPQYGQASYSDPRAVPGAVSGPPVKVALLVPLSGPHAGLGKALSQAAQMALFDMGYESFSLLPRDTKGTAQGAAEAAEAAAIGGAQLILGPLFAESVRGAQPVAASHGLNMIAFSTDWTLANRRTFVMGFLPFAQVDRVASYAATRGLQSPVILAPDDGYGNAVIAAWNGFSYRYGAGQPETIRLPAGHAEASQVIELFAQRHTSGTAAPFDTLVLPMGGGQARTTAALLGMYGLEPGRIQYIGTGLWDDPALASEASLEGGWFAAPSPKLRRDFERQYLELYGVRPARLATMAYDATALAAVLARSHRSVGQPPFDHGALTNPNGFAGIDGIFRFRPDGLVERGLAVLAYQNGRIVEVDPAPQTFQAARGRNF